MLLTYFTVIDKQKGRNIFNPYPTIPPIDRKRKRNQVCCNCCFTKTGFIIFGEIIMPCTACIHKPCFHTSRNRGWTSFYPLGFHSLFLPVMYSE